VVRIIEAPQLAFTPVAQGYGAVQPARVWSAVAQVSGRIVEIHPQLRNGEILPAGTELFHIDPVDYELNLAQAKASLAELDVQEANAHASLAIEQRNLALSRGELERIRKLVQSGTASQSNADEAERAMLANRTKVQNMQNTLALLPTQRRLLQAKMAQAERDLAHTLVKAPFNLRIANLKIEADEYVSRGQNLFDGDAVDRVEVVAQVAIASLRRLFIGQTEPLPNIERLNQDLAGFVGLRPLLRLDMGNHTAEWQAEFVRFSDQIDSKTRTVGVVVAVDKPFEKVRPGLRPPLSKGMFVEVILRGQSQPDQIVIPRSAVRNGKVYLVDAQNRLQRQPVQLLYSQGSVSVIKSGIRAGDRVVVSDPVPAVSGMLLQPQLDKQLSAELLQAIGDDS
jgi:RND family efflux transporter MFP subunit